MNSSSAGIFLDKHYTEIQIALSLRNCESLGKNIIEKRISVFYTEKALEISLHKASKEVGL